MLINLFKLSFIKMKYSEILTDWLKELGYTHCFFLNGGNNMHLVQSCSKKFTCVPFIHEVSAGIAAEYFNESNTNKKAFALVTAGPGLTNIVTAIAGAYLEGRDLLVIGGQVKTSDLSKGMVRQRGIQEVSGDLIVKSITVKSKTMTRVWSKRKFFEFVDHDINLRKGSKFLEIPIDIQGAFYEKKNEKFLKSNQKKISVKRNQIDYLVKLFHKSKRPIILIGGGVEKDTILSLSNLIKKTSIPFMTTWNGADRLDSSHPNFFGRPNTWGQRRSNIIIQQSDLLLALGTRLGLQQTGFNWQEFVPKGKIIHVDIDKNEIKKGHPKIFYGLNADANIILKKITKK
jgi:acetolactate synthase-1/2/3 large subunit